MATSGTFYLNAKSVDYTGTFAEGTCYNASNAYGFGRGGVTADILLNYSVSDSGVLTVSYNSATESAWWCICANSYHMSIDFSADGTNWSTIMSSSTTAYQTCDYPCAATSYDRAYKVAQTLTSGLSSATLTQSGYIRARMWAPSACPTALLPNAFPSDAASIPTAVPVHIDVNWTATLNYDATGGSGAPAAQTRTVSASATSTSFTVSNTIPTKANHRFDGWIYGGTIYHGGDTFTVQKSTPTVTLKAVWTEYYRPGATLYSADEYHPTSPVWYSNHKTNGACHIRTETDTWQEMRTIDGSTNGQGDPPLIYRNDSLYNQKKLGKTS